MFIIEFEMNQRSEKTGTWKLHREMTQLEFLTRSMWGAGSNHYTAEQETIKKNLKLKSLETHGFLMPPLHSGKR